MIQDRATTLPRLLGLILLGATAFPAVADDLTVPLTAKEVACNERQLELLLKRMRAGSELFIPPQVPRTLIVTYGDSGFYQGLALTNQSFRDVLPPGEYFERHLAFNLRPVHTLFLNPERPETPQVSLNREQTGSSFVQPGGAFDLTVTLDAAVGGGDPLAINNSQEPAVGEPYNGFLANSTKPARGLSQEGLLTPCHDKFTSFDRHVFAVLRRIVRATAVADAEMEIAIFRGRDPHTYRVNFYPIYEHFEERGRMATALEISWTKNGKLTHGEMKALPGCTGSRQLGCSNTRNTVPFSSFIPPAFAGREYYDSGRVQSGVFFYWLEGPSEPAMIDFEALLAGSTWNRPVW